MVKRGHRLVRAFTRFGHVNAQLLGPRALGNAFGSVSSIFLLIAGFMSWVNSYYNADVIAEQFPISFSVYNWTLIVGLIEVYVFGYIAGFVLATLYNRRIS
ncbi:MAG: hypothetical protein AABW79_03410 [Nanoarchaeota archaeon]